MPSVSGYLSKKNIVKKRKALIRRLFHFGLNLKFRPLWLAIKAFGKKTLGFGFHYLSTNHKLKMTTEILLRYVHFISIFAIVGSLVSEHLLLRPTLSRAEIARLARIDAVYGIAAVTLLTAGLTLWLTGVGKPPVYYTQNWIFHTKLTLYIIIGLCSIYPTVFFIKNRKGEPTQTINLPKSIIMLVRVELMLLLIIPLLAGLMSRGVGFYEKWIVCSSSIYIT